MKLKVIVHEAEEGEYRAEVPAIPGCATPGQRSGTPPSAIRRVTNASSSSSMAGSSAGSS